MYMCNNPHSVGIKIPDIFSQFNTVQVEKYNGFYIKIYNFTYMFIFKYLHISVHSKHMDFFCKDSL